MKIAECLTKEQKQQMNRLGYRKEKPPNKMTRKDCEEIMEKNNINKRVRGEKANGVKS